MPDLQGKIRRGTNLGDLKMNEGKPNRLIDTTDCLEAIEVFKGWKNFLFSIVILCLLLLQAAFWLVNTGYVSAEQQTESNQPVVMNQAMEKIEQMIKQLMIATRDPNALIEGPDEKLVTTAQAEPNLALQVQDQRPEPAFKIKIEHLIWSIRVLDFVLIPAAVLYCLCLFSILQISLTGRLGGMNHISMAFFFSLAVSVLLMPWQKLFGGVFIGEICTPAELLSAHDALKTKDLLGQAFYYARFVGFWLVTLLLLVFAQIRSIRWARMVLRRLDLI
jgi:hypothetical protein